MPSDRSGAQSGLSYALLSATAFGHGPRNVPLTSIKISALALVGILY
jgi:hypothetical protein